MRRWYIRTLWAAALSLALPAAVLAQQPQAPAQATPVATVVVVGDPYAAATPYNATVVSRQVPNSQYNRPNYTLPCENPNQNFDPLQRPGRDCLAGRLFHKSGTGHCAGCCSGGSCVTCCNTYNFILSSSRTFFGESSREFFERVPSVDQQKHPHLADKRAAKASYQP